MHEEAPFSTLAFPSRGQQTLFAPRQITSSAIRPSSDGAADEAALAFHADVDAKLEDVRRLIRDNQDRVANQLEANLLSDVSVESVEQGGGDDYYYYDDEEEARDNDIGDYYYDDYEEDLLRPPTDGGRAQKRTYLVRRLLSFITDSATDMHFTVSLISPIIRSPMTTKASK